MFLLNSTLIPNVGVIENCELSYNLASGFGGAIFAENSIFELFETQIMDNQAQIGGGIYFTNKLS